VNIHYLELFYYVARYGGISRAVRQMPYGIQQPAVSGQVLLLEEDLGTKLFDRRPFQLTPAGAELFEFIRPFFENLDTVAARLRSRSAPQVRIGASEVVLRDHLPAVIERVRQTSPRLRLVLRSGYQAQLEAWLQDREIDLAVTTLETRPPARMQSLRLVELPLVLLVHRKSRLKSAAKLWSQDRIEEPLISLPATEDITRLFQKGLKHLKVDWLPAIEASSLELVTRYVGSGYGVGVTVNLPDLARNPQVRVLPLDGFEPVVVAALWCGKPTPLVQAVLAESQRHAQRLWPIHGSVR
jgi:DNA-binding transcriptional LysR family regulator